MTWDRSEWHVGGHPDRRIGDAYAERYTACVKFGFSHCDAREQATLEAERVARDLRDVRRTEPC